MVDLGPRQLSAQDGQAPSIDDKTELVSLFSPNQDVISDHSLPAPTAAGIRSEASKRNVAVGSVRYFTDSWSIGSVYRDLSTPLFADTQPVAILTRLEAQSALDR